MSGEEQDLEVVRALMERRLGDGLEYALEMMAEDVVLQLSDGRVYVGHDGYVHWFQEQLKTIEDAGSEAAELEYLGGGWVLLVGAAYYRTREGEKHVQPGSWLIRVRNGKVGSVHFYRTEAEARAAINR